MAVAVLGLLLCVLLLVPCVVASGCKHDGREIPEGDVLTTVQPCFTCRCSSGSLQCRLQVCPRLPNPPPPGCELIIHTKKCCPQLVCGADKGRKSSSIATSRRSGCQLDGKYYREGTKLPTNAEKLCENCYCIKGQVHCTSITCSLAPHDCKPVIMPGSCCPSRYDCRYIEDPGQSTLFNETRGIKPIYTESSNNLAEETTRNHSKLEQKLSLSGEIQFSSTDTVLLQTLSEGRSNREMSSVIANITEMNLNNQTEETMQSTTVTDTTVSSATEQQYQSSPMSTTTDSSNLTTSDNSIGTTTIGSLVSTMETETLADISYNTTENTSSNNLKTETQTMNSNFSATTELTPINSTELSQPHSSVTFSTDLMRNQTDRPIISKSDNQVKEPIIKEKNKLPFLVNKTAEERIDLALTEEHVLEHNELRIDSTTEIVDDIITMQTESTFMTMMPTTIIMLEEVDTVNITLHSNVNITAYNNKNTLTASNTSVVPVRAIPPEIEAIINNTQKNQDYEEYDYNDPSLPPSLPGVRIIPFVAADAVVEEKPSPTVYPSPEKVRPTDSPVFFDVSHSNMFSPPVETEGGFVPHEPNLDGPFYDSKYNDPYHTTGMSIPSGHLPVDLTTGTIMPPSITILPKDERCLAGGREYHHGAAVPRPGNSCSSCTCYFGEVLCQPLACPPPPPSCHTAKPDPSACCPHLTCGDIDTPTVVLEAPQLPAPPQTGVVPPVTVATGVVTPDPFRDVIRTEPAPDLPALMGDIMPYLLERRGSTSPLPSLTTDFITTGAPIISQSQTTTSSTAHTTKTPLIKSTATTNGNPIAPEEEKEESEFSLDSVLQFLFSGETTAFPATRQTNKTKQVVTTTVGPPTTDKALYELHRNLSITTAQQNIASTAPPKEGPKTTTQISTTPATILTTVSQQSGLLSADPGAVSGLLKLAGCNIYGRMYRVGRIISELSGPCLECMCTEVGVQCRALDC